MDDNKKLTREAYDKYAEKWKSRQRDGSSIYHLYLEKPAMYAKLPDLKGKDVLCVGCGSGEEADYLSSLGAKKVVGIDISEKLIEIAKQSYPNLKFHVMDAEKLQFPPDSFDFAYSSLTLHYLPIWSNVLTSVHTVLRPGSKFLFSVTHPLFSATVRTSDKKQTSRILGYKEIKGTNTCEIYGDYLNKYPVEVVIDKGLIVMNYRRPLSQIMKDIRGSNFELIDIVEPKATDEAKESNSSFWEIHQKIPEFIIFELKKA